MNKNISIEGSNVTGFIKSGDGNDQIDMSNNVVNQVSNLPKSDQPGIEELLTQLKQEIESDNELSKVDKADLLEQIQKLREAKQTEKSAEKEGLVRKAKKIFDATLKGLPDTAKIVEAWGKLLPLILKALGLPT